MKSGWLCWHGVGSLERAQRCALQLCPCTCSAALGREQGVGSAAVATRTGPAGEKEPHGTDNTHWRVCFSTTAALLWLNVEFYPQLRLIFSVCDAKLKQLSRSLSFVLSASDPVSRQAAGSIVIIQTLIYFILTKVDLGVLLTVCMCDWLALSEASWLPLLQASLEKLFLIFNISLLWGTWVKAVWFTWCSDNVFRLLILCTWHAVLSLPDERRALQWASRLCSMYCIISSSAAATLAFYIIYIV